MQVAQLVKGTDDIGFWEELGPWPFQVYNWHATHSSEHSGGADTSGCCTHTCLLELGAPVVCSKALLIPCSMFREYCLCLTLEWPPGTDRWAKLSSILSALHQTGAIRPGHILRPAGCLLVHCLYPTPNHKSDLTNGLHKEQQDTFTTKTHLLVRFEYFHS